MRAVVIEKFGDPSGMAVREVPDPVPEAGQVLITPEAVGVGGVDAVIRRGTLGTFGFTEGLIPGSEVAGPITAVGDGIDPAWLGRRVWAFTGTSGAYADLATADLNRITALPDGLSFIDAVTLGSAAPVAHFALAHAHFTAGESVLVRGAAGSIGIATVELAARGGASTVAVTTSDAERGRRLRDLGATLVLDRAGNRSHSSQDHRTESDTFDVIIDIVGGEAVPDFIDRLNPNGRLVLVGVVAGMPPADFGMRLLQAFRQSRSFATFSLDTVPIDTWNQARAEQFEAAAKGNLHPVVHQVMALHQAADAHRLMDDGSVFGRIVLTP
ncbi:zinc-binding dehydrogenase [Catenulispora rubra]|uniref:zinc-binding dehydrogenase n=1 Tax=Catenulispora rubra TaxID=280293 RepID=UPI0018926601|nr:zinc-binding dehydrogenase [Catenulispora rubra]